MNLNDAQWTQLINVYNLQAAKGMLLLWHMTNCHKPLVGKFIHLLFNPQVGKVTKLTVAVDNCNDLFPMIWVLGVLYELCYIFHDSLSRIVNNGQVLSTDLELPVFSIGNSMCWDCYIHPNVWQVEQEPGAHTHKFKQLWDIWSPAP